MSKRNLLYVNLGILFVFSLFYSLPLLIRSNVIHFEPHDKIFHLSRSLGLNNAWTSPVNFNNFNHHGTMMNIFYSWLTLYPMYLFYSLTGSLVFAYQAYFTLLTLVTMLCAYYSMYRIKKIHNVALVFALLYSFSTYRTTNIFARSAFGESITQAFLPLIC